jgi:REP element-mobilizing transposase RayT
LYHLTNRGNERKTIFQDDWDRQKFLRILEQSVETYSIVLHGFVLMKNHWHLLAQTPLGNLSEFMRHFNITYTSHYNRSHNRSGHLYQGRYKSFLVDKETYLTTVSRYIHLNPVRISGFKKMEIEEKFHYLCVYKWSSLPGYIDQSKKSDFINYDSVLAEFGGDNPTGRQRYRQQIAEDLEAGPEIKNRIVGQSILGSDDFVSRVKEKYVAAGKDRERPSVGRVHRHISQEAVLAIVEQQIGMQQVLYTTGTTRQIAMTMLYKYAGMNNREIGDLLDIDYSTVSQGRSRLRKKVAEEKHIRSLVQRIEQLCQG